jgi:hypothetical protein
MRQTHRQDHLALFLRAGMNLLNKRANSFTFDALFRSNTFPVSMMMGWSGRRVQVPLNSRVMSDSCGCVSTANPFILLANEKRKMCPYHQVHAVFQKEVAEIVKGCEGHHKEVTRAEIEIAHAVRCTARLQFANECRRQRKTDDGGHYSRLLTKE